jgi:cysteine sulfinate desulfinase/cysteine desulfurase-like protein
MRGVHGARHPLHINHFGGWERITRSGTMSSLSVAEALGLSLTFWKSKESKIRRKTEGSRDSVSTKSKTSDEAKIS